MIDVIVIVPDGHQCQGHHEVYLFLPQVKPLLGVGTEGLGIVKWKRD